MNLHTRLMSSVFLAPQTYRVLVPQLEIRSLFPLPLGGIPTTGPPGKPYFCIFIFRLKFLKIFAVNFHVSLVPSNVPLVIILSFMAKLYYGQLSLLAAEILAVKKPREPLHHFTK